jgi:hypothetical protein
MCAQALAKVVSIATAENQEDVARQVRLLPRSALETLVRDEKLAKSVPGNTHVSQNSQSASADASASNTIGSSESVLPELQLAPEVHKKLFELQQKGIDINALLLEFLEKREFEIAQKKEELSARATSRYIPVEIKKLLKQEYGEKCSIKTCRRPAEQIHHSQRYALSKTHDPHYLAPLCHNHHVIAHSIDLKYHQERERRRGQERCRGNEEKTGSGRGEGGV